MAELPEGSADPVELAARIEDGNKKIFFLQIKSLSLSFLF
jgi:hypothetical protein